jgi:1,4-dihydroxy-2-naphthoyl-CoA hydrolase
VTDGGVEGEGLSNLIGIEYLEFGDGQARAQLEVTPQVMQPFGVLHGGALAALAESLCSRATYESVAADGMTALGMSNLTTFLRPIAAASTPRRPHATVAGRPGSGTAR